MVPDNAMAKRVGNPRPPQGVETEAYAMILNAGGETPRRIRGIRGAGRIGARCGPDPSGTGCQFVEKGDDPDQKVRCLNPRGKKTGIPGPQYARSFNQSDAKRGHVRRGHRDRPPTRLSNGWAPLKRDWQTSVETAGGDLSLC